MCIVTEDQIEARVEAKRTQEARIFDYLNEGNTLTPLEALEKFGCFRLGARIFDLRKKGLNVQMRLVRKGNKNFAEYSIPFGL